MKKSFKVFLMATLSLLLLWACKKDKEVEVEISKSQEKRNKLVTTIYDNEIKPKNDSLGIVLNELKSIHNQYTQTPTAEIKLNLQKQWLKVAKLTAECKLFNITPISRRFFFNNIHTSPINEDFLASFDTLYTNNELNISTIAVNKKGLSMLEYLFFEEDSLVTYNGLVVDYIDNLIFYQTEISNYWENDLYTAFTTGQTISLNDGFGELLNGFLNMLEVSKKERFDKPFGLHIDYMYPTEAPYSEESKELFATSFNYLDHLMTNYYGDFLACEGEEELANDIKTIFKSYKINFEALSAETFEEAQANTNIIELERIQDDITDIIKILKVDLSTSYDVLISFSDADGD